MSTGLSNHGFSENTPYVAQDRFSMAQKDNAISEKISREPPKIFYSTQYNLFEPHDLQRKLLTKNLRMLRESIERHNLLHEYPIIVLKPQGEVSESNRYKIVNGNHRFAVAQEKQLGFYFMISTDFTPNDIIDTGYCLAKWTIPQFCDFYCKHSNQEYLKFKKFSEDFNLDMLTALPLTKRPIERKGLSTVFRKGMFVFYHEDERRREVDEVCQFLEKAVSLGKAQKGFYSNSKFFDAYIKLMKHPKYNYKEIMRKFDDGRTVFPLITKFSTNVEFYNFLKIHYLRLDPHNEFKKSCDI